MPPFDAAGAPEVLGMIEAARAEQRGIEWAEVPTFEGIARQCFDAIKAGRKDERRVSWLASLENHVFPEIGAARIDAIGTAEAPSVLEPICRAIPRHPPPHP